MNKQNKKYSFPFCVNCHKKNDMNKYHLLDIDELTDMSEESESFDYQCCKEKEESDIIDQKVPKENKDEINDSDIEIIYIKKRKQSVKSDQTFECDDRRSQIVLDILKELSIMN